MPISNSLRGLHNLRTIQTNRKDADAYKENADYLKLFMLEKERTRLHNEQVRLMLRLETINGRLKEIEDFYEVTLGKKETVHSIDDHNQDKDEQKKEWKVMPLKY
jgi:hypothetical protein